MSAAKHIVTFFNEAVTRIEYTESLQERLGSTPIIEVLYHNAVTGKFEKGIFQEVKLEVSDTGFRPGGSHGIPPPTQVPPTIRAIKINHGGASTGIVKLN